MKMLFKCLLLLSGLLSDVSSQGVINPKEDLALRGNATQSSSLSAALLPQYYAAFAIDGNTNMNIFAQSCSSTDPGDHPWWRVDLLSEFQVGKVVITNREDCCSERINGTEIRIGNSLDNNGNNNSRCAVINYYASNALTYNFTCNMTGRYVNLVIPHKDATLTLCEVEVYKVPVIIKKGNVRMKFQTGVNLADSAVTDKVLQQLKSAMGINSVSKTQLSWTRNPLKLKAKDTSGSNQPCGIS